MRSTLQPLIDGGVRSYLIYDTGSTDRTIEVTREIFEEAGISDVRIVQEGFVDFATSRNRALEIAEEWFPDVTFFLMPDAEWHMHNVEGLLSFCEQHRDCAGEHSYSIMFTRPACKFPVQRLMRRAAQLRFGGVVHETITVGTTHRVPEDIYFECRATARGVQKSQKRYLRDKELLLQEYHKDPFHARTAYYLAQTYECLGDLENAAKYFRRRVALEGWRAEWYNAQFRLGEVLERLSLVDDSIPWSHIQEEYLKAYSLKPHRIEPLLRIAEHYWQKEEFALCYLFAWRALSINMPENEELWIDTEAYDFIRYEILSKCSWHVGAFDVGEQATRDALKAHPDYEYLQRNLEFYENNRKQG